MRFVHPSLLWLLAAGVIVVALYLVRRRRRSAPVPFLDLWQESIRAEAPRVRARRLRSIVSLVLELLVVAAAATALARPYRPTLLAESRALAILLDVTPTMDASDSSGETRLARARIAARRLLDEIAPEDSALVATTHAGGAVLAPFGTSRREVLLALDGAALSAQSDPEGAVDRIAALLEGQSGAVALLTDLATDGARRASARPGVWTIGVGDDAANAGILAVELVESSAPAGRRAVRVVARNFGAEAVSRTVRAVPVDPPSPAVTEAVLALPGAGEGEARLEIPEGVSGHLALRLDPGDAFPADDVSFVGVPAEEGIAVLVLSRGEASPYLLALLSALSPSIAYERSVAAAPERYADLHARYPLAIFDRCAPPDSRLHGPAIVLGADWAPPPLRVTGAVADAGIAEAVRGEPLMRGLDLDGLSVGRATRIEVPAAAAASVLVRSAAEPLLVLTRGKAPCAVFAFAFEQSSLWGLPALPVLFQRLVTALAHEGAGTLRRIRPGDAIDLAGDLDLRAAEPALRDARGRVVVRLGAGGAVPWIEPGLYRLRASDRDVPVAVSVEREEWSDIRCSPPPEARAATLEPGRREGRQELWILFATAALALLALHWFLFGPGSPRR